MPEDFSVQYPTTRAILDAAQIIPIQKPSNVGSRSATWSNYKLFNTLRVNRVYSKRFNVFNIRCKWVLLANVKLSKDLILKFELKMFHSGDRIMADMGIMVQNMFENKNVLENTTSMLSGRSQFEPK